MPNEVDYGQTTTTQNLQEAEATVEETPTPVEAEMLATHAALVAKVGMQAAVEAPKVEVNEDDEDPMVLVLGLEDRTTRIGQKWYSVVTGHQVALPRSVTNILFTAGAVQYVR